MTEQKNRISNRELLLPYGVPYFAYVGIAALGQDRISPELAALLADGAAALEGHVESMLELGSLDQPLLKRMMLEAPGTYHHSLLVSNLVEAVAVSKRAATPSPVWAKITPLADSMTA